LQPRLRWRRPLFLAQPAIASVTPPVASPCDQGLTTPDAIACAGYFSGNLIDGSPTDIAKQQDAIATLPGDFLWNGNWGEVDATKILSLTNGNQLDFGKTLFGQTIIGAHFGNVDGPAGNVSVFWLFDFGTQGADFVVLDKIAGFSNAALYTTQSAQAVPEAETWAMMIVGMGAAGFAMRRRRRPSLMQIA
jgi:hypothetical protein